MALVAIAAVVILFAALNFLDFKRFDHFAPRRRTSWLNAAAG